MFTLAIYKTNHQALLINQQVVSEGVISQAVKRVGIACTRLALTVGIE